MKKETYCRWFWFIFLLAFILLFSIISLALIPGDFGSAGGGLPDGCVDFEDLMIFALAYGSTPSDANWNSLCDIYPDDVIDFEDLMIFAMHYGECEGANWTVMVYMDGDNNLDFYAWDDLSELEAIGSSSEINVITQIDLYNSCSGTYRYFVDGAEQGATYPLYPDDIIQILPEQNMADPAVLNSFINWGINNYPANHYILVLWNHGGGWRLESDAIKGIIVDDTSSDFLTMAELVQGLDNTEESLDIIGFDACLMQMAEVYYELGSSMTTTSPPLYGVGSEESEWGDGWPYDLILADLIGNPSMTESILCETIVNNYITYCGSVGTLSALYFSPELTQSTEVFNVINSFANSLINSVYQNEIDLARSSAQSYSSSDYKDFYDFALIIKNNVPDCQSEAQAVIDLIETVVISETHTGFSVDNSHGLSIYLPDNSEDYDSSYDWLRFAIDTQWDEFLQSGEGTVTGVFVIPRTRQISTDLTAGESITPINEENNSLEEYQIASINEGLKGETSHEIVLYWDAYYNVDGYRVYRKVNNGEYTMIFEWQDPPVGDFGYACSDSNISEGNTYSYYVIAYGPDWETGPSEIASIEITAYTFLPPCSLISPADNSIITVTNPVFSWNPVGLDSSDLPYGEYYSGSTFLRIYDASTYDYVWNIRINDLASSTATYDQDGLADPLIPGHTYRWYIVTNGYDINGSYASSSLSETWEFYYSSENVVNGVWAYTITSEGGVTPPDTSIEINMFKSQSGQLNIETKLFSDTNFGRYKKEKAGEKNYTIQLEWDNFIDASGYKVYRRVNGGNYSVVHDELDVGIDHYYYYDVNTSPENAYTYYITAYGFDWETAPSQTVTRDTWLPPCSLVSPADDSIVTEPSPIFTCNPVGISNFPYGSIYSGNSILWVYDHMTTQETWERILNDDMITSTISYNDDGQAIPFTPGHDYLWNYFSIGCDEYGNWIAGSLAEGWDIFAGWNFTYSGN